MECRYCMGGMTSLELARSGADIVGAASFHGSLEPLGDPADAKNIKVSVAAHLKQYLI